MYSRRCAEARLLRRHTGGANRYSVAQIQPHLNDNGLIECSTFSPAQKHTCSAYDLVRTALAKNLVNTFKCISLAYISGFKTFFKPIHTLLRCTVRKRLRRNIAARLHL